MTNITDYLKPDTPDSVREYLAQLEEKSRSDALRERHELLMRLHEQPATWLLQVDASAEALFAFEDLDGDEGPFRYPRWKYSLESADDWNVRLVINPKTTLEAAREMIRSLADWVEGMSQEEYSEYSARHSHGPVIAPPSDEDFAPPF